MQQRQTLWGLRSALTVAVLACSCRVFVINPCFPNQQFYLIRNMCTKQSPELAQLLSLCSKHLGEIVAVQSYQYTPCYLWHDRPLYNDFGEQIEVLTGNTIYLHDKSKTLTNDLFHELGHLIGRKYQMVGNRENHYQGSWETQNTRLIAQVSQQLHWSEYLNLFSLHQNDFTLNAASELWAELFMLWHLNPQCPEARLLDTAMESLGRHKDIQAISALADEAGSIHRL